MRLLEFIRVIEDIKADRVRPALTELVNVQTPKFRQWFGKSKVVDHRGRPLMVFHGTVSPRGFQKLRAFSHFGSLQAASVFTSPSQPISKELHAAGKRIYPVYLRIENPALMIDSGEQHTAEYYLLDLLAGAKEARDASVIQGLETLYRDWERIYGYSKRGWRNGRDGREGERIRQLIRVLKIFGYDGIQYMNQAEDPDSVSWVPFSQSQIKYVYAEASKRSRRNAAKQARDSSKPITAYHATPSDIEQFHPMTHFGTPGAARHYFNTRPTPGTRTYRVKLQMSDPALMYDTREEHYNPAAYLDGFLALFTNDDKARDFYRLKPGENPNNFSQEELRGLIGEYEKDVSEWLKRNGYSGYGGRILGPIIRLNRSKLEKDLFRPWRKKIAQFLRAHGHDGIKYKNRVEGWGTWSYINLTPGQVKHTTVKEAAGGEEWIVSPDEFANHIRKKYGIVFDLRPRGDNVVDLESIQASRKAAPGTGTRAMEELTEWADANQVLLTLSLAEKGHSPEEGWKKTSSRGRLEKFYRRFGFVSNRGRSKRFDLSMYASMYRRPGLAPGSLRPKMQGDITDCRAGECFGNVTASLWGKVIGVIDLSTYRDTASIKWIRVDERFQRQAIATKMVHYVRQWLDMPVEFMGGTTPSGQGLYRSLKRQGMIEQ